MNLNPYLLSCKKISSKRIIDLNVNTKTIKLLEGKLGENSSDLGLGK